MNWTNARFFREDEDRAEFYAHALPCESCGDPCDSRTLDVDSGLMIGNDCSCAPTPEEPTCPVLYGILVNLAHSISEMHELAEQHQESCEICTPESPCNCIVWGDVADARDCEAHGTAPRKQPGSVVIPVRKVA